MTRRTALWTFWLVFGLCVSGFAQGVQTGTIRGIVRDQQNLPVPGALVTVTSTALQGPRSTTTDKEGGYALPALPAGEYEVKVELSGFATVTRKTVLPLGLTVVQDVTMGAAGVAEVVTVVAETPAPIATPIIGQNFKHEEIEALATPRNLQGIAQLAPGLNTNTPNSGQLSINGAFAFDNVFMVNGVDVNDNLFGSPFNLFIEDAIEETQVLTSGITAEYGRFSGGVVNAITKSGGNTFSGSYRTNFSNPRWSTQTPFELCNPAVTTSGCTVAPLRPDDLQLSHEGTFGGPIVKDRLWFFAAGRYSQISDASTLPISNLANTATTTNKRAEIKLTGTVKQNHRLQMGYLNNPTSITSQPTFDFTIDPAAVGTLSEPNWYTYVNYHGVLGTKLLVESQYSYRHFKFVGVGGTSTNIFDSPIITLTQELGHYNAQYFDATDPESRNNLQGTGNVSYFVNTGKHGRHELKAGYEFFRSQDTGGNSQSATNYVFDADYLDDGNGNPILDNNGRFQPVFSPGNTIIENWLPIRGATLNVNNNSLFAQDHWAVNSHLSADLGVRYEKVRTSATGGIVGIDTDTIVPRLAAAFDVQGNGRHIVHVSYGHYSGRYNEAQVGNNTNVANPDRLFGVYVGPAGQGLSFAPGFSPANYQTVAGVFPTANVSFQPGMSSPLVKEFTTAYGMNIREGKGYAEVSYIWRDTSNFIEDFILLTNGVTSVERNGFDVGTFTNRVFENTDLAFRHYQGLQFQSRYTMSSRWSVNGNYTLQLKGDGNAEGEAANQPGVSSQLGDYPEIFNAARSFPDGRIANYQRHKLRLWSVYSIPVGRFGDVSVSGLLRVNSGTTYSLAATNQPLSDVQRALIAAYPDAPSSQTVYFGERGIGDFAGYGVLDFDLSYNVPVFRAVRPWVKLDIYNLFNSQKLISWNTTVNPDPNSPTDSLGLATGYLQGSNFGKATQNVNFPVPFGGQTGGRTVRVAVGLRF